MLPFLCLLFLLSDIAIAKPARFTRSNPDGAPGSIHIPIQKRAFNVPSLTPSQRGARLLAGLNMAGSKYGIKPTRQSAGNTKREPKGFVQMGDTVEDFSYFASVAIGTPPVGFNVIMDTGSSDLIVASAPCNSGCAPDTPLYRSQDSSTSVVSTKQVFLPYGSGSATGTYISDVVSFAGFTMKQGFAALTSSQNIVHSAGQITGIFGLAWARNAKTGAPPFVQQLWTTGQLNQPLFAMALARWRDYTNVNPGGFITVGDVNTTLFSGNINYISAQDPNYWGIPMQAVTLSGKPISGFALNNVIIDSGTSLVLFPPAMCASFYAALPGGGIDQGNGLYLYKCSTTANLAFTFGGITYTVAELDFNLGYADNTGTYCYGGVGYLNGGLTIIGDVFLKNVYAVYNFALPAVGFATLSNPFALQVGYVPYSNGTQVRNGGNSTAPLSSSTLYPSTTTISATVTSTLSASTTTVSATVTSTLSAATTTVSNTKTSTLAASTFTTTATASKFSTTTTTLPGSTVSVSFTTTTTKAGGISTTTAVSSFSRTLTTTSTQGTFTTTATTVSLSTKTATSTTTARASTLTTTVTPSVVYVTLTPATVTVTSTKTTSSRSSSTTSTSVTATPNSNRAQARVGTNTNRSNQHKHAVYAAVQEPQDH